MMSKNKNKFCHEIFVSTVYQQSLKAIHHKLKKTLLHEVQILKRDDKAGRQWSQKNYPRGYTSYASANQMHVTSPTFAELEREIRTHVIRYIKKVKLNVNFKTLQMNTCWVNVMEQGCTHPLHIHPHSIISGTYYLSVPRGASAIRFEDPRYGLFMNRPPLQIKSSDAGNTHFSVSASAGDVVLFESWLRHDVPLQSVKEPRISISFNY